MSTDCLVVNTESTFRISEHEEKCFYFTYIGNYHTIELTKGVWQFELWGAAGGRSDFRNSGRKEGYGAYVSGIIRLEKKITLYGFVGGKGGNNTIRNDGGKGGFNGGGNGADDDYNSNCPSGGGGGSTDIRLTANNKYSRIIVAAGGGSPGCYIAGGNGGDGGTLVGNDGGKNSINAAGGKGGFCSEDNFVRFGFGEDGNPGQEAGGAGGGGYFGGSNGIGSTVSNDGGSGGGGGSSYVSGCERCQTLNENNKLSGSIHYSGYYFTDIEMISGNETLRTITIEGYTAHQSHGLIKIIRYGNIYERAKTYIRRTQHNNILKIYILLLVRNGSSTS